jgi:hypothetical protein
VRLLLLFCCCAVVLVASPGTIDPEYRDIACWVQHTIGPVDKTKSRWYRLTPPTLSPPIAAE